jgi:uncharacterized SAM-binding protein YcdF (DUF218 family)
MKRLPLVRSAGTVAAATVAVMVAYFVIVFVQVVRIGSSEPAGNVKVDAIVVMGAAQYDGRPSALLQERLERALALWNDGHARWVAVTGGKKAGDRFTEAGTSAAWLVKRGVPESRILYEETGRSTWESLSNLAPVLRWNGVESALMVTTDWHLARSVHSLRELGFRVEPARAGTRHSLLDQRWYRETAGVGIGRVVGFDRLHTVTG